ncbi:putative peptidase T2, asparaginase 2, nucleophile aminohydrolase [Helianthus debilis subsp. tardiflorus]
MRYFALVCYESLLALTEDGHVECDASIMEGSSGTFSAVGAVPGISGVKNAIKIAALLVKEQMLGSSLLGRRADVGLIAIGFLAGEGARAWAKSKGTNVSGAIKDTEKKAMLEDAKSRISSGKPSSSRQQVDNALGVICIDKEGNILYSIWSV